MSNMFGKPSVGKLMKQAARMQKQMEDVQTQLAARTVEASSGGGVVKAVANAMARWLRSRLIRRRQSRRCAIAGRSRPDRSQHRPRPGQTNSNDEMGKVTSGLNIPG